MTTLLNKAFKRAQGLPDTVQDEVAQRIIQYVEKLESLRKSVRDADTRGGDAVLDMNEVKAAARRRMPRR